MGDGIGWLVGRPVISYFAGDDASRMQRSSFNVRLVYDTELSMDYDLGGVDSIRVVGLHINGEALWRVPLRHESRCKVDSLSSAGCRSFCRCPITSVGCTGLPE